MKSRRGFFSALVGAVASSAAPVVAIPRSRERLALSVGLQCSCGADMMGERVNGKGESVHRYDDGAREVFRCPNERCKNYRKRFERPSIELREVGLVTDKMQAKIDADRVAFETSYYGHRLGE